MNGLPLIQLCGLEKSYGGVRALHAIDFDIQAGEVHALCGENGAGKSTLIKVLAGVVAPDNGRVLVAGAELETGSVAAAEAAGIAVMHQESTAFPDLNAVDNLYVGRELTCWGGWLLDRHEMRRRTASLLQRLGERIDLDTPLGRLPLAQRQMVALARALTRQCRLVIMDEPTASLSDRETRALLDVVRQLRADGVSVLYVSHRLDEVFEIADRVTVLRDGQWVATQTTSTTDRGGLIRQMVGRDVDELTRHTPTHRTFGSPVLRVTRLTRGAVFEDVSFEVRAGEIVGLAGLVGAGRSEIARTIFGIDTCDSGHVEVAGRVLRRGSTADALAAGIALVPEDRQHEGLVLPMTVRENLTLAVLSDLTRFGLVQRRAERELVERQMTELAVKAAGPQVAAATLSGGNQQKLVLGKWLARQPQVLLLDEPTRGIDVGAKAQVHRLVRHLAEQGMATVVISSELPELLAISDRVLVVREGRIVAERDGAQVTPEEILALALPDRVEVSTP